MNLLGEYLVICIFLLDTVSFSSSTDICGGSLLILLELIILSTAPFAD